LLKRTIVVSTGKERERRLSRKCSRGEERIIGRGKNNNNEDRKKTYPEGEESPRSSKKRG